jgi:Acetyltransferase (GNAT) domain
MGRIRACVESDVSQIAELHRRVWTSPDGAAPAISEAYFAEMLFPNSYLADDLSSLVYEDDHGRVVGCLGVMPRRMSFEGRPVRVAISHNFMVAPDSRSSLAGIQLMRAFFAGRQDLSIAQSNDAAWRVWEGLGGSTAPIYEMVWIRPLRPGRYLASVIGGRRPDGRAPVWLRAVAGILDAAIARMPSSPLRPRAPTEASEELTTEIFLQCFDEVADGRALRPEYDKESLRWIFDLLERKTNHGVLRKRVVRGGDGNTLGWYLYYARADGRGEVVQIAARPTSIREVVDHCFYDAWRQGVIALFGQVDPPLTRQLSSADCLFRYSGTRLVVNTRDPELMEALCRGDAFLTRLEGEWWINP